MMKEDGELRTASIVRSRHINKKEASSSSSSNHHLCYLNIYTSSALGVNSFAYITQEISSLSLYTHKEKFIRTSGRGGLRRQHGSRCCCCCCRVGYNISLVDKGAMKGWMMPSHLVWRVAFSSCADLLKSIKHEVTNSACSCCLDSHRVMMTTCL